MQGKRDAAMREHGGGNGDFDAAANHRHLHYTGSDSRNQAPTHGKLTGDTWLKVARASAHQLRAPRAWGLDLGDLQAAQQNGTRLVHIFDTEQLRHYWATTATIRRHGFPVNRGAGAQVGLALAHWQPTRGEAEAASVAESEPELEPVAVQGALW